MAKCCVPRGALTARDSARSGRFYVVEAIQLCFGAAPKPHRPLKQADEGKQLDSKQA